MPLAEERVIRFRGTRFLLCFLPLVLLIIASMLYNFESWRNMETGTLLAFVGIGTFVVLSLLLMPRLYFLRLSPAGLHINNLLSRRFYPWSHVQNFRPQRLKVPENDLPSGWLVVFDLTEDAPPRSAAAQLMRKINGYDSSFQATLELDEETLADLLNEWQERYGSQTRESGAKDPGHDGRTSP
jgi:hypothetical protein